LRVLDGAVACFDGVAGVEPQSETVWRQADKYGVPRMCFINKLDRTGANFKYCVQSIIDRLGAKPAVLYIPIGLEADLKGLVDIVNMRAIIWKDEALGAEFFYEEIPADLADEAADYRSQLLELVVDQDDDVMEAYLEGVEPDVDTLKKLIRKGTLNQSFVPVCCGSAFKNKGVQPLLDAVVDYLPSPLDIPDVQGVKIDSDEKDSRPPADDAPFSALAFKVMNDPFVGSLTFIRIYSGTLTKGTYLNSVKDKKEKVGRMLEMHANERKDVDEAFAGDIIALAGMKETTTGDTLCAERQPIVLERMEFPEKRWASRSIVCRLKIPASACRPIMNRARPSSRAWASFTSTSSLTVCVASSRWKPMLARRRWLTANISASRWMWTIPTRSSRAAPASLAA